MRNDKPWPAGTPCWADLTASDLDRSMKFYSELLGWTFDAPQPEFGNYTNARLDGLTMAGMSPPMSDDDQHHWVLYFATDDAAATAQAVRDAGGQVIVEPMQVADFGTMALGTDPTGAFFGWWQSGTLTGFGVVGEPGGFAWDDGMTRDPAASQDFYGKVFGWTFQQLPMGDYEYYVYTTPDGTEPAGGLGKLGPETPAEVPSHWHVYWSVADTDAACAKAAELGGEVFREPTDTEYGRIATLTGPDGERFTVSGPMAGGA
ncbi:VOC family protein [Naumannella huperziae]